MGAVNSILLTGATGYLGSNLLRAFIKAGYDVSILKRKNSSLHRIEDLTGNFKSYTIGENRLEDIFDAQNYEAVVHTATSYGRNGEAEQQIFDANVVFPLRLLLAAIEGGTKLFVNTDTSLPKNINTYSFSKKTFSEILAFYSSKIKIINIEPEYFYGPFDDDTKFITGIVHKLQQKPEFLDFTEGIQERDFIYIDDIVRAYLLLISQSDSLDEYTDIPVGSAESHQLKSVVLLIHELTGKSDTKLNFGAIPMRKGEIMRSCADISLLKKMGWHPETKLREGISKLLKIENFATVME